jgi:cytochrome c-type protein NrfB
MKGCKMDNLKLTMHTMINLMLLICIYGFSFNVSAETSSNTLATTPNTPDTRHQVTFNRDKDYACVQCHKQSQQTLHGTHGESAIEKIGREVKCVECHETIGPNHRVDAPQVIKYTAAQSKIGSVNNVQLDSDAILKANANCSDCHTPDKLREDAWVHDVHAKNATCSSCHSVHADGDKVGIQALDKKQKIGMCVDCHSDFNLTAKDKGE